MKVITGSARGMNLATLEGNDVRPTSSKVKEAVFSAIQFEIEGRSALDLFAGSGQLGIEALSRGAAHCVFIDQSAASIRIVEDNLKKTRLQGSATVLRMDAFAYLDRGQTFDLIFADPPYRCGQYASLVERLLPALRNGGVLIIESDRHEQLPEAPEERFVRRDYCYGQTKITMYRREDGKK